MTDAATATVERRFLITVAKPWKLWIWPSLALLYFLLVLIVVAVPIRTGVPDAYWVYGGLGLFALLVLVQLMLLPTVRVRRRRAAAEPAATGETLELEGAEDLVANLPAVGAPPADAALEYLMTTEDHKGRRVLEVSVPGKSAHRGAVYAKAYVAIDETFVLRVEDLVADRHELG